MEMSRRGMCRELSLRGSEPKHGRSNAPQPSLRGRVPKQCRSNLRPEIASSSPGSHPRNDGRGFVLLLTMVLMLTLTAGVGGLIVSLTTDIRNVSFQARGAKAFWLSEAGLADTIRQLKNDPDFRMSPSSVDGNLGDGTYTVSVSKSGSTYTLTSTGTVEAQSRRLTESLAVTEGTLPAFDYVQHSGDDIDFKDSLDTVITGDISAIGQVKNHGDVIINGTVTENSSVTTPTVDLNGYQAEAAYTVNGNKTFEEGQTYSGIWYVNGKATIQDNVTVNGTIVATGDIKLEKAENVTINPASPYPALVSNGKIKAKQLERSTINGLIFALDAIEMNQAEDNTIDGALVSGGDIEMKQNENVTVTYNSNIKAKPPPHFSGGGTVTVTAQKDWDEVAV